MNGVKFGDRHSVKDWNLIMTSKNIGEAEPQTSYLEIPGRNGSLDLTEAFGEIYYKDRTLTFQFDLFQEPSVWWELDSKINNYLHGKKHKIILDVDDNFYYLGRCKVSALTNDKTVGHLTVECQCDPYKYKLNITRKTFNIPIEAGIVQVSIYNLKKRVVPTIYVDKNVNIKFGDTTYSLSEGKNVILNIMLEEGENIFEILSDVNITFEYQEATL